MMAVFTALPREAIGRCVHEFGQGCVRSIRGTVLGSENSNFYVHTMERRLVATVLEASSVVAPSFSACLAYALCLNGLPTPAPSCSTNAPLCATVGGMILVAGANLVGRVAILAGQAAASRAACALAVLHMACIGCMYYCPHIHGEAWVRASARLAAAHSPRGSQHALEHETSLLARLVLSPGYDRLPRGLCHYDLFQDNVSLAAPSRTARERLSGCFDFHFAGCGQMVMDAAILSEAWPAHCAGRERWDMARAALHAYQTLRPLTRRERSCIIEAQRAASIRFWTSRLCGYYRHRVAGMRSLHEPRAFRPAWHVRIAEPVDKRGTMRNVC